MSKPKFVFFKMFGCGHCVNVAERPTPETSVWAQLTKDQSLTSKVDFVMYEWGMSKDKVTGELKKHALPQEYQFVNYGPYFYLQNANDSKVGFEMKNVQRTHDGIKTWIEGQLRTQSGLKVQSHRMPATRQTAPPVVAAKANSARVNNVKRTAGQGNWDRHSKHNQLPAHVQKRIAERKAKIASLQGQDSRQQRVSGGASVQDVRTQKIAAQQTAVVQQAPAQVQRSKFSNLSRGNSNASQKMPIPRNAHLTPEVEEQAVGGIQFHARSNSKGMSFKPQKGQVASNKKFIARNARK